MLIPRLALAQVKGGRTFHVSHFRDFRHVMDRERAALGCFVTLPWEAASCVAWRRQRYRWSCSELPRNGDGAPSCGGPFARLVDLVGALARPLAVGAGAVLGGVQLVGHLRP